MQLQYHPPPPPFLHTHTQHKIFQNKRFKWQFKKKAAQQIETPKDSEAKPGLLTVAMPFNNKSF